MIQETYERFEEHGIFFLNHAKMFSQLIQELQVKNIKRNTKSPEGGKEEYKVPVYLRQRRITFIRPTINSSKIMKKDYRNHQSKERRVGETALLRKGRKNNV